MITKITKKRFMEMHKGGKLQLVTTTRRSVKETHDLVLEQSDMAIRAHATKVTNVEVNGNHTTVYEAKKSDELTMVYLSHVMRHGDGFLTVVYCVQDLSWIGEIWDDEKGEAK